MNQPTSDHVDFGEVFAELTESQLWEYDAVARPALDNVSQRVFQSLQTPIDFPPLAAAIVPGDRVALAVDPGVPQLTDVIRGIIDALSHTEAAQIDIVLWDEATEQTIDSLQTEFSQASVTRHQCDQRSALRYLAADPEGDPLYLNRLVVDADFTLPVIAHRAMDQLCRHDVTGVYPSLSDSATRLRHQIQMSRPESDRSTRNEDQVPWLLGVHLTMSVKANRAGQVGEIITATPEALGKQVAPPRRIGDEYPPPASLVIASIDGDAQQQSWANAARAAIAACRYVRPGGTIVLWSAIDAEPTGKLQTLDEYQQIPAETEAEPTVDEEGRFPAWRAEDAVAQTLSRIANDFRLLVHSRLPADVIESMGIGCLKNPGELSQLCHSFDSCGVLRAAQFAGNTIDAPHRLGIET
jgi:hypothetical protein